MTVAAPGWPGMSWVWDLIDLSTRPPLLLPHYENLNKQLFSQRFTKIYHITAFMFGIWPQEQIILTVLRVSGKSN